jgi:ribonucleoside-diphosphate reductase subunit M2
MVLAFFASGDGIVNSNLRERFLIEFTPPEIQVTYSYQMMIENIHSEVYSDLIQNIIKDPDERTKLFNSIETIESVKKMSQWAINWIKSDTSIGQRIIAFSIFEGVFFSGMFALIFWVKKMRGDGLFLEAIIKSNRLISRDEGIHVLFACELYKHIINKVDQKTVHEMFKEANEISAEFMRDAIKCQMIGMNNELMNQYINYISDRLLVLLGYDKLYNTTNPFSFIDTISLHSKDNGFETRITEYQSAHNKDNQHDWDFEILEKF